MIRRLRRASRLDRNFFGWGDTDPYLLVEIANSLDAHSLLAFEQVCRSWRDAVVGDAADLLWESLLRECFPRALKALELLPVDSPEYKEIFRDQLKAMRRRPSAKSTFPAQLSDFVFHVELIKETAEIVTPAPIRDARFFWSKDNPTGTAQEYYSLPFEEKQRYIEMWGADNDRYTLEYDDAFAAAMAEATVVQSWAGDLSTCQTGPTAADFDLPFRWDDFDPLVHPDCDKFRVRCFVSRVIKGQLRTLLLFTSDTELDDAHDEYAYMFGQPILFETPFDDNGCGLMPELNIGFRQRFLVGGELSDMPEDEVNEDGARVCDMLNLEFQVQQNDRYHNSDPDQMTPEDFLRYLEFGLPWRSET